MELTHADARALMNASRVNDTGAEQVPRRLVAIALASVLTTPLELAADLPGVSWVDADGRFNTLLREGTRLVHARITDAEHAEAAAYGSPVDTLEAAEIEDMPQWGELDWLVRTWRVTLLDGTVFSLRGGDYGHADNVAAFAHEHLQPKGA
jgi:hypothetical protein